MGVYTKGFIDTKVKDVLVVGTLAERALIRLISDRRRQEYPDAAPFSPQARAKYQVPMVRLNPSAGTLEFDFVYDSAHRCLTLLLDCDSDHRDHCESSLSMMMGASGESELFVRTVLDSLAVMGEPFVNVCDATDTGYVPARPEQVRPTLLQLLAERKVTAYDFEKVSEKVYSGLLPLDTDFRGFVGCEPDELRAIEHLDPKVRWARLEDLARSVSAPAAPAGADEVNTAPAVRRRAAP